MNNYIKDEVIIVLQAPVNENISYIEYKELIIEEAQKFADKQEALLVKTFPYLAKQSSKNIIHLKKENINLDEWIETLKLLPEVLSVTKNNKYELLDDPQDVTTNDPLFVNQWYLKQTNITKVWNLVTENTTDVIAIIDTGVNYNLNGLKDNIIKDSNDNYGYDFFNNTPNAMDDNGHGTTIASIIGYPGNNNTGMSGILWNCKILPIKVVDENGAGGNHSTLLQAFEYVLEQKDNGVNITFLNVSLIYDTNNIILDKESPEYITYKLLEDANILIITGSGNDGVELGSGEYTYDEENQQIVSYKCGLPACYSNCFSNIITVGSIDINDNISEFSNTSFLYVNIFAPGETIVGLNHIGEFKYVFGTSYSTPIVLGILALMKQHNPSDTIYTLKNKLLQNGNVKDKYNSQCSTSACVDALLAINGESKDIISDEDNVQYSTEITDQASVLLPNNKILIFGGYRNNTLLSQILEYDIQTDTFIEKGLLPIGLAKHIALVYDTTKVLLIGGIGIVKEEEFTYNEIMNTNIYLYDYSTNEVSIFLEDVFSGVGHAATLFDTNKLFICGGDDVVIEEKGSTKCVIIDLITKNVTIKNMSIGRSYHTVTEKNNGDLLIFGGKNSSGSTFSDKAIETYTLSTDTFGYMNISSDYKRFGHTATKLSNGNIIFIGGSSTTSTTHFAWLEERQTYKSVEKINYYTMRYYHTALKTNTDEIILIGGYIDKNKEYKNYAIEMFDMKSQDFHNVLGNIDERQNDIITSHITSDNCIYCIGSKNKKIFMQTEDFSGYGYDELSENNIYAELPSGEETSNKIEIFKYDLKNNYYIEDMPHILKPRINHQAIQLNENEILFIGGFDFNDGVLSHCELFDMTTKTSIAVGNLNTARMHFSATLLPDGKVCVAGGVGTNKNLLNTIEFYDPILKTWEQSVVVLAYPRAHHTSFCIDNEILFLNGYSILDVSSSPIIKDESYNLDTDVISELNTGIVRNGVTLQYNYLYIDEEIEELMKIIIIDGGYSPTSITYYTKEITKSAYSGNWESYNLTKNTYNVRAEHAGILIPNTYNILFCGGINWNDIETMSYTNIYNFSDYSWTDSDVDVSPLNVDRCKHTMKALPNGNVVAIGGINKQGKILKSFEIFDVTTKKWTLYDNINISNTKSDIFIVDNKIMFINSFYNQGISLIDYVNLDNIDITKQWQENSAIMLHGRVNYTYEKTANDILIIGGNAEDSFINECELYNISTNTFTSAGMLNYKRINHKSVLLPSGNVLVFGGMDENNNMLKSVELYNKLENTWTVVGNMQVERMNHTVTLLSTGNILIVGGTNKYGTLNSSEIYNPITNLSVLDKSLNDSRECHVTCICNNDVYVLGGRNQNVLDTIEKYTEFGWVKQEIKINPKYNHKVYVKNNIITVFDGWSENKEKSKTVEIIDVVEQIVVIKTNKNNIYGSSMIYDYDKNVYISNEKAYYGYDMDIWLEIQTIPNKFFSELVFLDNNNILLFGGYNENREYITNTYKLSI